MDLGLAVEVADDPVASATAFAEEVRDLPAMAVQYTNRLVDPQRSFEDYCERAIEYQWDCVNDPEHHEAIDAFSGSRDPRYDRDYA